MESKLCVAIDLKVSVAQLWETMKVPDIIPKLMPDVVAGSEYIEGTGEVGSIRLMKFGPAVKEYVTFSKEKIEMVDEASKKLSYSVIDGELLNFFKVYRVSLSVVEGENEDSCTVNWEVEYEPLTADQITPPEVAKQGAVATFKAIEAYLLRNAP